MPTSNNALIEEDLNEQLKVKLLNIASQNNLGYVDGDHCENKKYGNQLYLHIFVHGKKDAAKLLSVIPETDRTNWNPRIVQDDRRTWIELNVTEALIRQNQAAQDDETDIEPEPDDLGSSLGRIM